MNRRSFLQILGLAAAAPMAAKAIGKAPDAPKVEIPKEVINQQAVSINGSECYYSSRIYMPPCIYVKANKGKRKRKAI
jgi:hypothetical protein